MILAPVIHSFTNGWEIRLALALDAHLKWVHTSRLTFFFLGNWSKEINKQLKKRTAQGNKQKPKSAPEGAFNNQTKYEPGKLTLLKTCKNQDSYIRRGFIRIYWYCWKHRTKKKKKPGLLNHCRLKFSYKNEEKGEHSKQVWFLLKTAVLHFLPVIEFTRTLKWGYLRCLFKLESHRLWKMKTSYLFKQFRIDYYIYLVALNNQNVNFILIGLYQSV